MPYAAIDLFCGVGGLTKGLEQAGINVVAGIDLSLAVNTHMKKITTLYLFEKILQMLRHLNVKRAILQIPTYTY